MPPRYKKTEADRGRPIFHTTPDSPTPVVWRGLLFLVTDQGIAKCLDARTGELRWQERLKGQYRSSPLAVDGKLFIRGHKSLYCLGVAHRPQQR